MGLESATYISGLVGTNPTGGDDRSTADDHLRLIKNTLLNTFPNITGAMNASHTELNFLVGQDQAVGSNDSPTFVGLTLTGAFTSLGINDDCTGQRAHFTDLRVDLGTTGADYEVVHATDDRAITLSGGSAQGTGANLVLYGSTHATKAGDFLLRASTTNVIDYDHSATLLDLAADVRSFSNSAGTEQARFTSTANLLIGSTSDAAGARLRVTAGSGGTVALLAEGIDTASDQLVASFQGWDATHTNNHSYRVNVDVTNLLVSHYSTGSSSGAHRWMAGNNERMRLTNGGNLLLGTTTDSGERLYIEGATNLASRMALRRSDQATEIQIGAYFDTLNCPAVGVATAHDLALFTNNTERARINSGGDLGIGTTAPGVRLEVREDGVGNEIIARIRRSNGADHHWLDIHVDPDANTVEYRSTGTSSGSHLWYAGNTERARITIGGNLLIGTTTDSGYGIELQRSSGSAEIQARATGTDQSARFYLRGNPSGGALAVGMLRTLNQAGIEISRLEFRTEGSANQGGVYVSTNDGTSLKTRCHFDEAGLFEWNSTNGQGIKFPADLASTDANTLDDYEEGSFTPTITGSGGGSGQVYSTRDARYVKIGKTVYIEGRVSLSSLGTISGNCQLGGFPFTAENNFNTRGAINLGYYTGFSRAGVYPVIALVSHNNTDSVLYMDNGTAGMNAFGVTNFSASGTIYFSGTYRI